MENVVILGSTGSIGIQGLSVIEEQKNFAPFALVGGSNVDLLIEQAKKALPKWAIIYDDTKLDILKAGLNGLAVKVASGETAIHEVIANEESHIILGAISGFAGLKFIMTAIQAKKKIALANKETLVAGGDYILDLIRKNKILLTPVDSEHSAIFQCLQGQQNALNKILLTASGGPFRDCSDEFLKAVTPEMALQHPNWSMGNKITIDSATLANKGLEVIEAHYLFNCSYDKIDVVIHRESIVHSMIELTDTSVLGQMGYPSMKGPILYGLSYPERLPVPWPSLDLAKIGSLHFSKPKSSFRVLPLAFEAGKEGAMAPIIYNGANEVAVDLFLKKKISFLGIANLIEDALENVERIKIDSYESIIYADECTREYALNKVGE
ncbi:hypothetical protein AZF37_02295 [endosymbiont 'TC1' of Trimyema compressum]|uniref:1-deoxy-D-xylulose-5-phosphate reductoisomerase n=1 Tax=endosymbiont 'TC1' of Trimyema compressum TaxID=243899 RepID=UPI0007F0B5BD|nr:1-deoxy-D-xylulose-5-phosphate reductoisomerase [endosymbiont 'TC1' of Trimyema compressum]AMP20154.1 hypothetical protein AZF37_02295 [endosymbiont 'TC1' of Trimyema compressum]